MKVSSRTQRKLADLFAVLAVNEKNLNEARIALSKARGYNLEALFHRLDFHHRSLVNFEDLLRFFEINCMDVSKDEAIWLIEQINKNRKNNSTLNNSANFQSGFVNIDQFREFITPLENIKKEEIGRDIKKGVTFQQDNNQALQPSRSSEGGQQQQQKIEELNPNSNNNSNSDRYIKQNINPIPLLDPETEYVLAKLLKECLSGQKQRLSKQSTLSSCTDFELERLFKAVDTENIDRIDNRELAQFVQRKERSLSEKEASILIELYGDKLGKYLNINHFAVIIGINQPQQQQFLEGQASLVDQISGDNGSAAKLAQDKVEGIQKRASDQHISMNQLQNTSKSGVGEVHSSSSSSSLKNVNMNSNNITSSASVGSQNNKLQKQEDQQPRRLYQIKQLYSSREIDREMDAAEEDNFAELLADWMQSDIAKEDFKEELMSERDFSLYGAFKFLDIAGRGRLTAEEIFARLHQLGVPLLKESVYMLFKEYDLDFSGKLDFQEFCRTLSPLSVEHSLKINNRVLPNGIEMSRSTQMVLLDTLNCILENARYSEALRQLLNKRNGFSPYQAFCMLDTNRNGYVTPQDFREFFVAHNRHFSIKEIMHFFRRFDKQLEGQLTYGTFFAELAPKAPFVVGINREEASRNNRL